MNCSYRHYKGGLYEIVCEAHDSEVPERELIVYRLRPTKIVNGREMTLSDHELTVNSGVPSPRDRTWVRPKTMFFEHIDRDGYNGLRFRPVQLTPICRRCGYSEDGCKCTFFCSEQYEVVEVRSESA